MLAFGEGGRLTSSRRSLAASLEHARWSVRPPSALRRRPSGRTGAAARSRSTSPSAPARAPATSASPASTAASIMPIGPSASLASRSWDSEPFTEATTITGHALVDLTLASSEPDAALFVYLSEIEQDGRARYITEGLLRALHRAEAPCPPAYRTSWPFRTFARADARPLVPGRFERIRIPCLPVSWQFAAGSRLRVSIAGTDADHCGQVPHGRPPALTLDLAGCRVRVCRCGRRSLSYSPRSFEKRHPFSGSCSKRMSSPAGAKRRGRGSEPPATPGSPSPRRLHRLGRMTRNLAGNGRHKKRPAEAGL